MIQVEADALLRVRDAALSRAPISLGIRRTASPHEFYRYPARFSPDLASSVIEAFTDPGDLVADYFVGGGTTLVEARLLGRLAFGSDINSLSVFVSRVKTRLYDSDDLTQVIEWAGRAAAAPAGVPEGHDEREVLPYFRNMTGADVCEQRELILHAVAQLDGVQSHRARDLARCVLLRTAQWALDMRREVPSREEMRQSLSDNAAAMVDAARVATRAYRVADRRTDPAGVRRSVVLHQGLPGVAGHPRIKNHPAPKLVLTSPPYPGVYVNYHRWKIRGRKETPFPYFLAGQEDGNGLAYYTMAARSDPSQRSYFTQLEAAFADVAQLCDQETTLIQVVGFSDVADHLARYLVAMNRAGFEEVKLAELSTASDGRLWRAVPGRRWWTNAGERSGVAPHTAHEVILVHRLSDRVRD